MSSRCEFDKSVREIFAEDRGGTDHMSGGNEKSDVGTGGSEVQSVLQEHFPVNVCNEGVVCNHEGPCHKECGGDHYFDEEGVCGRCGLIMDNDYNYDDPMDGDAASALASAGWGTDEDYGGGDERY